MLKILARYIIPNLVINSILIFRYFDAATNLAILSWKINHIPYNKCFEDNQNSELFKWHKLIEWRIATWDQFISNKETKQHIIEICNPACVEMEWAAIAHARRCNKIPFVILRCMSDCADDNWSKTYEFNEKIAAEMSATLVKEVLEWRKSE